ncbi:MAG: tRNA (adenosine(37)-N6)-threonylcarbamoyltransferase complex ATPase subunit type 1 TsaE [Acidobacteriota bacterium]|nr:tRNA (adenosine(37)-N6)-threonylcarbamoyltransferase complex ATPase subunit type 1 TsaE [Acidobacteriota bacterium]
MKSVRRFETHSDEETLALGRDLAQILPSEGVVLLIGDLGAGKTTLTKGIVEGRHAAAAEDVTSPTFTLIHEYGNPVRVFHVDLYRLDTAEQARRLGLEEFWNRQALVLIEWGDRFPELLPRSVYTIRISRAGEDHRSFEITSPD